MRRIRVIPVLLIQNGGLVKTVKFRSPVYIGDPINAVRIFNEKEVDEIVVLDISATPSGKAPDLNVVREIAEEAFMPFAYGGGITTIEQAAKLLETGVEKIVLNTAAVNNPALVTEIARRYGAQSVIVSIDVKKNLFGKYRVCAANGKNASSHEPVALAKQMESAGAGELIVHSIDRDGTYEGYDLALLSPVSNAVTIPVIACGGARGVVDFLPAVKEGGCSAVAAGSMFVFHGSQKGILISYPSQEVLKEQFYARV